MSFRVLRVGCLALQGVTGTIKQCLFESNLADFGGAIFRGSANGVISGNVFNTNRATRIGGAIYDSHAKVRPAALYCRAEVACWLAMLMLGNAF